MKIQGEGQGEDTRSSGLVDEGHLRLGGYREVGMTGR
jgi:hypothetical protein